MQNEVTIFHITHWKAGSQWIYSILKSLVPDRIIAPEIYGNHFFGKPIVKGGIYPTLYLTRDEFLSVNLPSNSYKFVIIRDLRDTLVSGYFSIRYSHKILDARLASLREKLNLLDTESGLLFLMSEWLPGSAKIQASWIQSEERIIRYEDLLTQDIEILENVLIEHGKLQISPERLRKIVKDNRFKNITGGRINGDEDLFSHHRKGVVGDWKNYFTPKVVGEFESSFGYLLEAAGYQ